MSAFLLIQHLELKRQHGAEDEDLERLEKEAFGPAVRPGDPGYETGESPIEPSPEPEAADEPATGEEPSAEQAAAEATAPSAEATLPDGESNLQVADALIRAAEVLE